MKEKIGQVFSIAADNAPVPGCTISKEIASVGENTITCFSLAPQTDISAEIFPYYKFLIVAVDKDNNVISTSRVIHAATLGGKVGNAKSITTKAKKSKVSIKAKKTFKLKAKQKAQKKSLKIKNHRALKYESTKPSVATVSSKGVIKGVSKGTCEVYVYAQNGVCQKIKVTVK